MYKTNKVENIEKILKCVSPMLMNIVIPEILQDETNEFISNLKNDSVSVVNWEKSNENMINYLLKKGRVAIITKSAVNDLYENLNPVCIWFLPNSKEKYGFSDMRKQCIQDYKQHCDFIDSRILTILM